MKIYQGKKVNNKSVVGKVLFMGRRQNRVIRRRCEDPQAEIARVDNTIDIACEQLEVLYDKAVNAVGEEAAYIFRVHQMLLRDTSFVEGVYKMILDEGVNAEYAVNVTGRSIAGRFSSMEDEYFSARATDITDITERLLYILRGSEIDPHTLSEPTILVADDLGPSETIAIDKNCLIGFVTKSGSITSHTAILAKMLNIPAIVGCKNIDTFMRCDGKIGAIDGEHGLFILEPDEPTLHRIEEHIECIKQYEKRLTELIGLESTTKSGLHIDIMANAGGVQECKTALDHDAAGVGLFRSEFIFMGRKNAPTEGEQYRVYRKAAETMGDLPFVVRTLDIGSDKQASYLDVGEEANPAMGLRGIRLCYKKQKLFRTQLRALLRAAANAPNLKIMYPMVVSTLELQWAREEVEKCARELEEDGIPYRIPSQGLMIETPAAVVLCDQLAQQADFFSIGTNDLTQYTLAIDRQNEKMQEFFRPHHPAILRMIKYVIDNGHAAGIRVGLCGGLGSDPEMIEEFVKMGLDSVSVAPSEILELRKIVRKMD